MTTLDPPLQRSNTLGKGSLILGILALVLVFSVAVFAFVGASQGWLPPGLAGTLVLIFAAPGGLMGLLGTILGFLGLWGRNRPRGAAIAGMLFSLVSMALFLMTMSAFSAKN